MSHVKVLNIEVILNCSLVTSAFNYVLVRDGGWIDIYLVRDGVHRCYQRLTFLRHHADFSRKK